MSDLTFLEKLKLEKLFGMDSGRVLSFTNQTFAIFVGDSTGKDITESKYGGAAISKANRLRVFWKIEPNHVVAKLLADMLQSRLASGEGTLFMGLGEECARIAERLRQDGSVEGVDAIEATLEGQDFEALARGVKDAIERNEPESGLDRLHTYLVKYVRVLCEKHGVEVGRDKPLHSILGEYIKQLKRDGLLESQMAERILKSDISIADAFSHVRNDHSLAHDNPILSYEESRLIFSHVASSIRFIKAIESRRSRSEESKDPDNTDYDLPF